MTEFHSFIDNRHPNCPDLVPQVFGSPNDVLRHVALSGQQKRAILAAWASDANAVPHVPSLRQLPDGSIVKVDEILQALKALDARHKSEASGAAHIPFWQLPFKRRRGQKLRSWPSKKKGSDSNDDDDPPPCPAYAAVKPRGGCGGAIAVYPEPVAA